MSEADDDPGYDLLTSPLRNVGVARMFVWGGPIGLAIAIVLSLWASWMHVRYTVQVQIETQWIAFEHLALRARLVPEGMGKVEHLKAEAWVEQGAHSWPLPDPSVVEAGLAQVAFDVPDLEPGVAQLHLTLQAEGTDTYHETIDVEVVTTRAAREGTPTVSSSTLQRGDDSDPQLEPVRIDIRPEGRLLSEFDNRFWVRVLHPDGRPYDAEIEVVLLDGELGAKAGSPEAPVQLRRARTDALGLVDVRGRLGSEVVRLAARVLDGDGQRVRFERRMRFVSYAGAVNVTASTTHVQPAAELEIAAQGLSTRRPVFVDVHDPGGAWIDTFDPPVYGFEEPRPWKHPALSPGILQIEAYNFTHDPGESTAIARVQVVAGDPEAAESLRPLVAEQRARLHLPRVELDFDRELERRYLDRVEQALTGLDAKGVERARAWLLGTLPVTVYGLPTALDTRQRDLDAMAAKKQRWMMAMRIFLLGGGGLFLAAMTVMMLRSHARAAASTMAELARSTDARGRADVALAVQKAKREALLRGLAVILVMATSLVIATILLERLVWIY